MNKKLLIAVTDSDFTGAPVYANEIRRLLESVFIVDMVVSKNGSLIKGHELKFNTKSIYDLSDISAIIRAVRILNKVQPEIIWLNSFKMSVIMRLALLATGHKCQVFYTVHGLSVRPGKNVRNNLIFMAEKVLKNHINRYVFLTEYDASIFKDRVFKGLPSLKIPNFSRIDTSRMRIARKKCKTFLMIARNEAQKDYETLLRAFAEFSQNKDDVKLHCVGRNTKSLSDTVLELELGKKVQLHGEQRELTELFEESDCFVLSTNYEGMPLVILEAFAHGLPVIASEVSGMSEFISIKYGRLVEKNSIEDLARAFLEVYDLNENDFRKLQSNAFREYQTKYSREIFKANILSVVKSVTHKRE